MEAITLWAVAVDIVEKGLCVPVPPNFCAAAIAEWASEGENFPPVVEFVAVIFCCFWLPKFEIICGCCG